MSVKSQTQEKRGRNAETNEEERREKRDQHQHPWQDRWTHVRDSDDARDKNTRKREKERKKSKKPFLAFSLRLLHGDSRERIVISGLSLSLSPVARPIAIQPRECDSRGERARILPSSLSLSLCCGRRTVCSMKRGEKTCFRCPTCLPLLLPLHVVCVSKRVRDRRLTHSARERERERESYMSS